MLLYTNTENRKKYNHYQIDLVFEGVIEETLKRYDGKTPVEKIKEDPEYKKLVKMTEKYLIDNDTNQIPTQYREKLIRIMGKYSWS